MKSDFSIQRGQVFHSKQAMARAIELAEQGLGFVEPNPAVGCVVLDSKNRLIGEGYHKEFGGPHAEIHALRSVENPKDLEGAQVYVTLEPCSHQGKTPPCANELARLPLAKVIYGLDDPNPEVSGKGLLKIRESGIEVVKFADLELDLKRLSSVFLKNMESQKTFLTLKIAASIDGKMCLSNGESQWITGEDARERGHQLRGQHQGILTTAPTILQDNPELNSRAEPFLKKVLDLVIIDLNGDLLQDRAIFKSFQCRPSDRIFFVTSDSSKERVLEAGFQHLSFEQNSDQSNQKLDFEVLKKSLFQLGISSLLLEVGPGFTGSILDSQAWDRLTYFQAPLVLGGRNARGWADEIETLSLKNALQLGSARIEVLEKDLLLDFLNDRAE